MNQVVYDLQRDIEILDNHIRRSKKRIITRSLLNLRFVLCRWLEEAKNG